MRGCAHDPKTWRQATAEERDAMRLELRVFTAFLGHASTEKGKRAMLRRRFWRLYMGIPQ